MNTETEMNNPVQTDPDREKISKVNQKVYLCFEYEKMSYRYELDMLSHCEPKVLLPVAIVEQEMGNVQLRYRITGLRSLEHILEFRNISEQELEILFYSIHELISVCSEFLLDENDVSFRPSHIFQNESGNGYLFCFNPFRKDRSYDFSSFMNYLSEKVDYDDSDTVNYLYRIEKLYNQENNSMENMFVHLSVLTKEERKAEVSTQIEEASTISEDEKKENEFDPGYLADGSIKEKMKGVKHKITGFMSGKRKVREQNTITAEPVHPVRVEPQAEEDDDATMMLCNIHRETKAALVPREVRIRGYDLPEFVLEGESFSIGKMKNFVEGFLPAGQVSRYHLVLKKKDEKWLAMDLNSTNGTWINNEKISAYSPCVLCDGDRIRIADLEYVFALE